MQVQRAIPTYGVGQALYLYWARYKRCFEILNVVISLPFALVLWPVTDLWRLATLSKVQFKMSADDLPRIEIVTLALLGLAFLLSIASVITFARGHVWSQTDWPIFLAATVAYLVVTFIRITR